MRYWLSVGATPTPGAQNILEKYGFVPHKPRPFGQEHAYTIPRISKNKNKKKFYWPF
jgi:ribosomal protein S16